MGLATYDCWASALALAPCKERLRTEPEAKWSGSLKSDFSYAWGRRLRGRELRPTVTGRI
jgi:hypothetical protein